MDQIIDLSHQGAPQIPGTQSQQEQKKPRFLGLLLSLLAIAVLSVFLVIAYFYAFAAPPDFKKGTIVRVSMGDHVADIAKSLADAHVISSPDFFELVVRITGAGNRLQQGEYLFDVPQNVRTVVSRIARGDYGIVEERILIREGLSRKEIAGILKSKLPAFSVEEFMLITGDEEGYLFPDTYVFFKTATTGLVVSDMRKNFLSKTSSLKSETAAAGKDWSSIITVASLVELEGKTKEDRALIADIIYRRIEKNMPLQLDAPFLYFMNKASLQLTQEDLYTQSPYNTYRNKGLPPTPISNPGVDSIYAALHPTQNEYLYYLSDKEGLIHYAKTFEEHKLNKQKYL